MSIESTNDYMPGEDQGHPPDASLVRATPLQLIYGIRTLVELAIEQKQIPPVLEECMLTFQGTTYEVNSGLAQQGLHYQKYVDRCFQENTENFFREMTEVAQEIESLDCTQGADLPTMFFHRIWTKKGATMNATAIALLSAHLYGEARTLPTQVQGWYTKTVDNLAEAQENIRSYVEELRRRNKHPMLGDFFEDLYADLTSFHTSCLHTTNMFAMHAQEEDCAVYVGTTPHAFSGNAAVMKRHMQELLALPVYQKYNKNMRVCCGVHGKEVDIPTYVSAVDIDEFVKLWKRFWQEAANSLKNSMSGFHHFFRPQASPVGQARIVWSLPISGNNPLNIRLDQEIKNPPHLSLDIGKAEWQQAFNYAKEIGDKSLDTEVVMGYSSILNNDGDHAHVADPRNPLPRGREVYYPSVLKSQSVQDLNARMALIAGVILTQARSMGCFGKDTFGYHCRGGLTDTPKHNANFTEIVKAYRSIVPNGS